MLDLLSMPDRLKRYHWKDKHGLYGFPADTYPTFCWITSLEERFQQFCANPNECPTYLILEMIRWGGSQNGIAERFCDGLGSVNLHGLLKDTINALDDPNRAIRAAVQIPGMGLTYASKLFRFMRPTEYGALDSFIRKALLTLSPHPVAKIYDGDTNSKIRGFVSFTLLLHKLRDDLNSQGIERPATEQGNVLWRAADVEMALFVWSQETN